MLRLNRQDFTCGRSRYLDFLTEAPEPTSKVFVKIRLEGRILHTLYAQVDTGAPWSVLAPEIAEDLGLLDSDEARIGLDTRLGLRWGTLVRIPIRFLADDGEHFDTDGTFFICPDWPPGRTFLGYSGLLDSMRFALDPQVNHFYFGS